LLPDRRALAGLLVVLGFLAFSMTGETFSSFSETTSNGGNSFAASRIFAGARTTSAWDVRDASSGTAVDVSPGLAFAGDGITTLTGFWTTTFSSSRYLDIDFNNALPAGLSTSGVTFDFAFAPSTSGDTACYYFEVRRASTGTVLGTHGSSGSPVACNSTTTQLTTNTNISSEVTSTDIANDLRVRVYVKDSGSRGINMDLGTILGSTPYSSFTLYRHVYTDASTGTPLSSTWAFSASGDGAVYISASNWPTSFNTSDYLKWTFPAYVPTGASVTSATFNHSYRSATSGDNTCYYFEVYDGATLLATHGSSGSPVSCNSTTSYATDSVSLPEVNTPSIADNVVIKMYVKNSGGRRSSHDLATLTLNYSLA
jgi:hypothetical protein